MTADEFADRLPPLQRAFKTIEDTPGRDAWYAQEFFPEFAPVFAAKQLKGAPGLFVKPTHLVSLLGLSWQPVALLARWVRPERMLIIATLRSANHPVGREASLDVVRRWSGVDIKAIDVRIVEADDEVSIYGAVKEAIARWGVDPVRVAIDATGGKKSMSVAAGLAAYYRGAPLLYVDYEEYEDEPLPGTEYPRLLADPFAVLGELKRDKFVAAFNACQFGRASTLLGELGPHVSDPERLEVLRQLTDAYLAWTRFDLTGSKDCARSKLAAVTESPRLIDALEPDIKRTVEIQREYLDRLDAAIPILRRKNEGDFVDGFPAVVLHLAAAKRALGDGRFSEALMLAYSTIERVVTLFLWTDFGIDAKEADYAKSKIAPHINNVIDHFNKLGPDLHGRKRYRPVEKLPRQLAFMLGIQLVAVLDSSFFAGIGKLARFNTLADDRNKCEFEHGLVAEPVSGKRAKEAVELATTLVRARVLTGIDVDTLLGELSIPKLFQFERP